MLDFFKIAHKIHKDKKGNIDYVDVYPKFIIKKSNDLMIRGSDFYAVWIEEFRLWSTDEQYLIALIDNDLEEDAKEYEENNGVETRVLYMWDAENGIIDKWHKYCQRQMRDNYHMLDEKIIFSNVEPKKRDYASKKLDYPLVSGDISAYDTLISTLYSKEERHKIEWAIGSIINGDSKNIQKFMVLYGAAGTGKSTILNIIQKLFEGYYAVFDAKAIGSASASFALEAFKTNPLIAIQHDGDLSRIEDNTRLNSLVSHELMTVNEKFKSTYTNKFNAFLFMGTNKPVKITDGKSGLIRRLIDVTPTGKKVPVREYNKLFKQIDFELGAIASHCLEVYESNPGIYDDYIPKNMMSASNDFYNYVLEYYRVFKKQNYTTLKQSWEMYNTYCTEARVPYPMTRRIFKEELKNYFWEFEETDKIDGTVLQCVYKKFRIDKFEDLDNNEGNIIEETKHWIVFKECESVFDNECFEYPAQYANSKGNPSKSWDNVKTKLSDMDTSKLHYVLFPDDKLNHIIIDFDIPDENGDKCLELNLKEANKWPKTYAELSKSGQGIHLHYYYQGDPDKLSRVYDEHIEIKVFKGKSSLRRLLSKCNDIPINVISSGLPLKGVKQVISKFDLGNLSDIQMHKYLSNMIERNIDKEFHASTKSSIDFIKKILDDAYNSGVTYDVTDKYNRVLTFGAGSTNQSTTCLKTIAEMHFKSKDLENGTFIFEYSVPDTSPIAFFDIEVFPNLLLVNWKLQGPKNKVIRLINPETSDLEDMLKNRLIGFNCRRYDNHVIYARMLGYSIEECYELSKKIISGNTNAFFSQAYNLSYTDVYDFAATKQSLKKWEIELGIHHKELGFDWDQPVPKSLWDEVAAYCDNDVIATEAVFDHLHGDFLAREILAELAGMTVNSTTNSLTTKIIFGDDRNPELVYTDLATGERTDGSTNQNIIGSFPGYEYKYDKELKKFVNMYRGVDLGFGGYVYANPGMYGDVALLDIKSMHPNSAVNLNAFGKYTQNFKDILDARLAIKEKRIDDAKQLFGGRLAPYLDDEKSLKALAQALKIAINSVYGLTSASFENSFRDKRNKNNIIALRGALFMKTLQDEVEKRGYTVVHIKTDSIKIADATQSIIDFCFDFAKRYGYEFDHEATYERICLVNNAVYIAKYNSGGWTATGTQFKIPYVFKTLFSKENIEFSDLCETKSVKTSLYLDFNENMETNLDLEELKKIRDKFPDWNTQGIEASKKSKALINEYKDLSDEMLDDLISKQHNYHFVGKVGSFCPIKEGYGGGVLLRYGQDNKGNAKYYSVTGTKGYRWLEAETVKENKTLRETIDRSYFDGLVNDAIDNISNYGDFEWFVSDAPYEGSLLWEKRAIPF